MAASLLASPLGSQGGVPLSPDSGAFVTRLGADTIALERFVRSARRVEADVVLRVPRTVRTRYVMDLSQTGVLERLEGVSIAPLTGDTTRRELIVRRWGDSLDVTITTPDTVRTRTVVAPPYALPFVDMIHWPFELVLTRAYAMSVDTVVQPLLTGARVSDFRISRPGGSALAITHPSRGTMRARVDESGRLLSLDAAETTRKLIVERQPWLSLDSAAARWARLDAAGKSLGALSGRGDARATVRGANIVVDYGRPAKRGRAIWGALIPFGQVWRTGANRATHLETDRALVFGSGRDTLRVPAGKYTLFSIPTASGGLLIVSRETEQSGNDYDPTKDLGRVRLVSRRLGESVELFTIEVAAVTTGGELRLHWDRRALVVPFRVR